MKKIILKRVVIITLIMGLFGNVLQRLIGVITDPYFGMVSVTGLAMMLALLGTLVISILLKGKPAKKKIINIAAISLFVGSLIVTYIYNSYFIDHTLYYKYVPTYYIAGEPSDSAKVWFSRYDAQHLNRTDALVLKEQFGGEKGLDVFYEERSVKKVRLNIISIYVLVVLFFSSTIYFVAELLATRYRKTEAKLSA